MKSVRVVVSRLRSFALTVAAAFALAFVAMNNAYAQKMFESPDAAMAAFGDALASNSDTELQAILGARFREFIPPIPEDSRIRFLSAWARAHSIKTVDDTHAEIAVGDDGWTLPIPLAKSAKGWQCDARAGGGGLAVRRLGQK